MREAVGWTFILTLIIPIVLIFIMLTFFAMDYSLAYRAGNYFVEQIETCQAMSSCEHTNMDQLKSEIKEMYHYHGDIECSCEGSKESTVCSVILGVDLELPVVGKVEYFKFKVQTKPMYSSDGNFMCNG